MPRIAFSCVEDAVVIPMVVDIIVEDDEDGDDEPIMHQPWTNLFHNIRFLQWRW